MGITRRLAALGGAAVITVALGSATAATAAAATWHPAPGTVFVQTNNLGGNTVVAYRQGPGGGLTQAGSYPTGGLGGQLHSSVADHLSSQDSLVLDRGRGLLYAVNAGSNTVTVFGVHGDRLSRRQVISSGGTFPVSIAARGDLVYVLNARRGGSIQGYRVVAGRLVRVPAWKRYLKLDESGTPEFVHTPGEVLFSPGGAKLLVLTKGAGSSIEVFGVGQRGAATLHPVVNAEPGALPFSGVFDGAGHLAVAAVGTGSVDTFALHGNGTVTLIAKAVTGQQATCWISAAGRLLEASNAGSNSVSGYWDAGHALTALGNTGTSAGTVDSAFAPGGRYLYVQTGIKGIVNAFRVGRHGALTAAGSVTVPGAVGGEGIVVS
jgi:hypothetical protein